MAGTDGETGATVFEQYVFRQAATNEWGTSVNSYFTTPHVQGEVGYRQEEGKIHPRLYFKYIKTKFNILEERFFQSRLKKLQGMADEFAALGQQAMSEACIKSFIVMTREAAIWSCGFKKFLTPEHVDKFRYRIKVPLLITPLRNFARVLPKKVADRVKVCVSKKLFDDYVIFHLDQKSVKSTEKERIERERDPILFGKLEYSDRYYFIIDWEDEMDDLKLEDIIEKLSLKKDEMTLTGEMRIPKPEKKI